MRMHLAATAYVFNEKFSKILLIKHKTLNCWLPPGGHLDKNESLSDAAIRELKEETGVVGSLIDINQQKVLSKNYSEGEHYCELLRPYAVIEELIPKTEKEDEHKHIDAIYVVIADSMTLPQVKDKQISQSKWFSVKTLASINTMQNVIGIVDSILEILGRETLTNGIDG